MSKNQCALNGVLNSYIFIIIGGYNILERYRVLIPARLESYNQRIIKKYAKKEGIPTELALERWTEFTNYLTDIVKRENIKEFQGMCLISSRFEEKAIQGSEWRGYIYVWPIFLRKIINDDKKWVKLAKAIACHELGHIKYSNETRFIRIRTPSVMMLCTLQEVQADFMAAKFMQISTKEYADIKELAYSSYSERKRNKKYIYEPHPAVNARLAYLREYEKFSRSLLKRVFFENKKKNLILDNNPDKYIDKIKGPIEAS